MATKRIPGASELDRSAHAVFAFAAGKRAGGWRGTGVLCARCGHELKSSYCEERLYMVRCQECETVTLVKAASPAAAAERLGIMAQPADEWCEEYGDCLWWSFPIEEPPYLGTPISWDRHGDPTVPDECTHFTRIYLPMEDENER